MDLWTALGVSVTAAVAIDHAAELLADAERERLRRTASGSHVGRPTRATRHAPTAARHAPTSDRCPDPIRQAGASA